MSHIQHLFEYFRPILTTLATEPSSIHAHIVNTIQPHYIVLRNGNERIITSKGMTMCAQKANKAGVYLPQLDEILMVRTSTIDVYQVGGQYQPLIPGIMGPNLMIQYNEQLKTLDTTPTKFVISNSKNYYIIVKHNNHIVVNLTFYDQPIYSRIISIHSDVFIIYDAFGDHSKVVIGDLCEIQYHGNQLVVLHGKTYTYNANLRNPQLTILVCNNTQSHMIELNYPYYNIQTIRFDTSFVKKMIEMVNA